MPSNEGVGTRFGQIHVAHAHRGRVSADEPEGGKDALHSGHDGRRIDAKGNGQFGACAMASVPRAKVIA